VLLWDELPESDGFGLRDGSGGVSGQWLGLQLGRLPDRGLLFALGPMPFRRYEPGVLESKRNVPRRRDQLLFALPAALGGLLFERGLLPESDSIGLQRDPELGLGRGIDDVRFGGLRAALLCELRCGRRADGE